MGGTRGDREWRVEKGGVRGGEGPPVEEPRGRGCEQEPGGAGRELLEEGDAEKAAWHRRLRQRDGQPSRALALAHTRSHSRSLAHSLPPVPRRDRGSQASFTAHPAPSEAGTYSCHLHRGQLSPSQQQQPPPPAASGSSHPRARVRAGRPSPPPSALLLAVFTTFPPGQWRTPGDQPEGAGRGGVRASPAFFLQRTLYMVVRG